MFADMIRNSNTESEIYFLLNSYIEAVGYCDKLHCSIPDNVAHLPLSGITDVRKRFAQLMIELDTASKRLDDNSCTVIKEGVHILSSALTRLSELEQPYRRVQNVAEVSLDAQGGLSGLRVSSRRAATAITS